MVPFLLQIQDCSVRRRYSDFVWLREEIKVAVKINVPKLPEKALLRQVHTSLKPGGLFVLDVLTEQAFEARQPDCVYAENLLDGFWSANDYFGFQHTFTYPDDFVTLDQYTIIEAERTWQVFNWLTHFRPDDLLAEFEGADFEIVEMQQDLFGPDPSHHHHHVVVARART